MRRGSSSEDIDEAELPAEARWIADRLADRGDPADALDVEAVALQRAEVVGIAEFAAQSFVHGGNSRFSVRGSTFKKVRRYRHGQADSS